MLTEKDIKNALPSAVKTTDFSILTENGYEKKQTH